MPNVTLDRRLRILEEQARLTDNQRLLTGPEQTEAEVAEDLYRTLTNSIRQRSLWAKDRHFICTEVYGEAAEHWQEWATWLNGLLDARRDEGQNVTYVPLSSGEVESILAHLDAGAFGEGANYGIPWNHSHFPAIYHHQAYCPDSKPGMQCEIGSALSVALSIAFGLAGLPRPENWEVVRPWLEELRSLYPESEASDACGLFITMVALEMA
jgi:hypothetical protein